MLRITPPAIDSPASGHLCSHRKVTDGIRLALATLAELATPCPAGRACLVARQFRGRAIFKFFELAGRAWLVSPAVPALSPTLARQPDNLHQKALFGIVKTYKKLPKNLYDFFCVFACFSCISMLGLYQNQKAPTNRQKGKTK